MNILICKQLLNWAFFAYLWLFMVFDCCLGVNCLCLCCVVYTCEVWFLLGVCDYVSLVVGVWIEFCYGVWLIWLLVVGCGLFGWLNSFVWLLIGDEGFVSFGVWLTLLCLFVGILDAGLCC